MTIDDLGRRILGWTAHSRSMTLVVLGVVGICAYVTRMICLYMFFRAVLDLFINITRSSVYAIPERHHRMINASLIIWTKMEDMLVAVFTYIADMITFKPDWYIFTFIVTVALTIGLIIKNLSEASQGDTITQVRAEMAADQYQ